MSQDRLSTAAFRERRSIMAQRRVEAVERALALLEAFSSQRPALTLTELSQLTGFYKSTILRLMASLEHYGYVMRDERGIYRIGSAVSRLAPLAEEGRQLEQLVRPILVALRDLTQETASFHVREGEERRCLLAEIGRREVRHHLEEGGRLPLGQGATGRVLRGEIPRGEVTTSNGERHTGLSAIAIGVYGPAAELMGALTLSGATAQLGRDAMASLIPVLQQQAQRLEQSWPLALHVH
jgi:DNA-binding IclR family transcriptional regulator